MSIFVAKSNSHWSVTITSETANLNQSERRKINSHLEIYTKGKYPELHIYVFLIYGILFRVTMRMMMTRTKMMTKTMMMMTTKMTTMLKSSSVMLMQILTHIGN